ncbi:MAG: PEP-CTERM sorting domain-containing protein [Desulfobulbus sp.]|nr:PEP-CTERM sorting domain-containing protein [Desulfobulbus sp.]
MKLKFIVGLAVLLMATQAHALSTSDVTLGGNDADSYAQANNANSFADIQGMAKIGEVRNNGGGTTATQTIDGITYTFSITAYDAPKGDLAYGTWLLSWSGNTEDLLADFVLVISGQGSDVEYRFGDVTLAAGPAGYPDNYFLVSIANGSGASNLSFLDLYVGNLRAAGDEPSPVPEPTTMLLFGAGLLGLAGMSRRKN